MPAQTPPATLRKAFRAYLDTGSITSAARAVDVHPKTIQRHARNEQWKKRREKIERAAADQADAGEIDRLTAARLGARYKWSEALSQPATRELVHRPT